MSYLNHLKRIRMHKDSRWIVKNNPENGKIREVKLIFNPAEYQKGKRARILYNQKEIIKLLENDKKK